jgi:hypothetical protein
MSHLGSLTEMPVPTFEVRLASNSGHWLSPPLNFL